MSFLDGIVGGAMFGKFWSDDPIDCQPYIPSEEYRRVMNAQAQMFANKKSLSNIQDAEFEVIEPKQLKE